MKTLSKVLALLVVCGLAASVYAKGAKGAAGPKPLMGVVKEVKAADNKIVVTVGKGEAAKDQDVATDANTKVKVNGADATLADLKAGMKVTITPAEGTAQTIEAKDAAAPKNPK